MSSHNLELLEGSRKVKETHINKLENCTLSLHLHLSRFHGVTNIHSTPITHWTIAGTGDTELNETNNFLTFSEITFFREGDTLKKIFSSGVQCWIAGKDRITQSECCTR
jgi:hypothetical protein